MTFDVGLLTFYGPTVYTLTDVWKMNKNTAILHVHIFQRPQEVVEN